MLLENSSVATYCKAAVHRLLAYLTKPECNNGVYKKCRFVKTISINFDVAMFDALNSTQMQLIKS